MLRESRGFTLVEVVIVVAILGILASVGYPSYLRYIREGQVQQAVAVVNALVATEKIARERNGSCVAGTPGGWVSINTGDGIYTVDTERVDTGEAADFEFKISAVGANGCTVTGRGRAGGFGASDTLVCVYDATANPRQTWSGNLAEYM